MNLEPVPDFSHTWPDGNTELFTHAVEGMASLGANEHLVRIGFTVRKSSGQPRSRSLVVVDRYPTVEFVSATDVVPARGKMASVIKDRKGKQILVGATVPAGARGDGYWSLS